MNIVSTKNAMNHYNWGNACEGWNLVAEASFSVKQEKMPSGTAEQWHYHQFAQQFFYIITGTALFEIEEEAYTVEASEGMHIPAGKKHRIVNQGNTELTFILSSQPSTANDRINL
jgi:mannose-6-phosphate isomerase-like protein (cupin superfamily)